MSEKFSYKGEVFTESNFKSEFILACLRTAEVKSVNWPREMRIMLKLIKIFSCDPLFWYHARPTFPIPSLAWFFKKNGKAFLSKKKREFELNDFDALKKAEEEYEKIEKDKVGEDLGELTQIKTKKIKSLKDWLN